MPTTQQRARRQQVAPKAPAEVPEVPETNHVNGTATGDNHTGPVVPDTDAAQLEGLGFSPEFLAKMGLSAEALAEIENSAKTVTAKRGRTSDLLTNQESAQKILRIVNGKLADYVTELANTPEDAETLPIFKAERFVFIGKNNEFTALTNNLAPWSKDNSKTHDLVIRVGWTKHPNSPNSRSTSADDKNKIVYMVGTLTIEFPDVDEDAAEDAA